MMKIHHIGYVVKKIDKAIDKFHQLGYSGETITRDEYRGIDICFMENDGYRIELVSPYRADSTVSGLLKRTKNAPYHICYISSDIEKDMANLAQNGYMQISELHEAPAIDGKRVIFMNNASIGMIELVEE